MNRRDFIKHSGKIGLATCFALAGFGCGAKEKKAALKLMTLPYAEDALAPYVSMRTVYFHYGKHHQKYMDNMKSMISGTPYANMQLFEIVKKSKTNATDLKLFQQAAQVFNHNFYWQSMRPGGGGAPGGKLAPMINAAFGDYRKFTTQFRSAAAGLFGNGWLWLVQDGKALKLVATQNAATPVTEGLNPLLNLDLWEHAYYLDYQNRRDEYVKAYLDYLVNWKFAESNLV